MIGGGIHVRKIHSQVRKIHHTGKEKSAILDENNKIALQNWLKDIKISQTWSTFVRMQLKLINIALFSPEKFNHFQFSQIFKIFQKRNDRGGSKKFWKM